jgi:hypothetical protein
VGRRVARLLQLTAAATVLVVDPYADPAAVAATGAELVTLADALPCAARAAPLLIKINGNRNNGFARRSNSRF